jgi:hypothetical protein
LYEWNTFWKMLYENAHTMQVLVPVVQLPLDTPTTLEHPSWVPQTAQQWAIRHIDGNLRPAPCLKLDSKQVLVWRGPITYLVSLIMPTTGTYCE